MFFSGLIKRGVEAKLNHDIKVARQAPQISHPFFVCADNGLLFSRATRSEARAILDILATYQQASGQVVNLDFMLPRFWWGSSVEGIKSIR